MPCRKLTVNQQNNPSSVPSNIDTLSSISLNWYDLNSFCLPSSHTASPPCGWYQSILSGHSSSAWTTFPSRYATAVILELFLMKKCPSKIICFIFTTTGTILNNMQSLISGHCNHQQSYHKKATLSRAYTLHTIRCPLTTEHLEASRHQTKSQVATHSHQSCTVST